MWLSWLNSVCSWQEVKRFRKDQKKKKSRYISLTYWIFIFTWTKKFFFFFLFLFLVSWHIFIKCYWVKFCWGASKWSTSPDHTVSVTNKIDKEVYKRWWIGICIDPHEISARICHNKHKHYFSVSASPELFFRYSKYFHTES